ncbi:MAG TPA: divalent metal cation transporter [Herbaspirillum sp.]|jgi:Mn2+/Fe2+ NRAMP family transporter|nr:divalent metal cation transporter [Herbaspirillum sp.]
MTTYSMTKSRLYRVALTVGPGLVVMLADTEAGSVITAAQSGAEWGYRLLLLQFLIIPLLFMAQELTVRLGLGTGKGYGELIRLRFGRTMAFVSMSVLIVSCCGALLTELSGLAGVGQLFGVPVWQTSLFIVTMTFVMMWTGSYHSVERIAIFLGLFGLTFLAVAWKAHPDTTQVLAQMRQIPLHDHRYLYLVAANLGTSIMPWTMFYQQSALLDKGLSLSHLKVARAETLGGAILCQSLQAAVLVAAAASLGQRGISLDNVPQIAEAFTAVLGNTYGRVIFAVGVSGGAMVATIVVCLTAAWSVGEATGVRHSLEQRPSQAPWFYAAFGIMLIVAGTVVSSGINLVDLSIATGVVNALLLPIILLFLYRLACTELPETLRLKGFYAYAVGAIFTLTAGFGLYAAIAGMLG